jgi:uncharacterized membrane protein YGL010W
MMETPRPIELLLQKYTESHTHPVNERIHFVCVPVIVWTVLALLWAIHPYAALAAVFISLLYYWRLSTSFALGMLLMSTLMLLSLYCLPAASVLPLAAAVFVLAWIGQFIGHHIEGKKPSFFEDLQYLLVGPLFVLSFLYKHWKIPY